MFVSFFFSQCGSNTFFELIHIKLILSFCSEISLDFLFFVLFLHCAFKVHCLSSFFTIILPKFYTGGEMVR